VRYYLLALTTGAVERVYWWQLVARGYGLCHEGPDGDLNRRPSFAACRALSRNLSGSTFVGPLPSDPDVRLFRFRFADSNEVVVGWTTDEAAHAVDLPRTVERACDRDGNALVDGKVRSEVEPAPRYFWLQTE
jgi:hypothetical protein